MKIAWKGKRWLALALAFVLLLSMLPPMKPLAFSEEIGETLSSEDYKKYIGCDAWFAGYSTPLANDPETAGNPLSVTPFNAYGYENIKLVIEDCYYDATYDALWYKVKAAPDYTLPNEVELKPWVFQDYVLNPWGASLKIAEPETIAGTVTDSNGNPILGSDGQPLTVTVSGGLPEGAELKVSVPQIDGETLPNVFDIKIYDKDGKEWQPIDEGRTVTISIPVDTDAEYVDVYHFIDYKDAIHEDVEMLDISAADDTVRELLGNAIVAYGDDINVAYETFKDIEVIEDKISMIVDSFSVYYLENGVFKPAENDDGVVNIPINDGASGSIYTYYASAGTTFKIYPSGLTIGTTFTLDGAYSDGVTVKRDDYLIYQVGTLTVDKVSVGDVIRVRINVPHVFSADEVFYVDVKIVREVKVAYDANGKTNATGMPDPLSKVIATDGTIQYTTPDGEPTAPNCTFKGWGLNNAGTGTIYQPGAVFTLVGDLNFFAIWEEDKFDVSFDHNYKIGDNDPQVDIVENVLHDSIIEFPEPPDRENYTFLGWCASQTGDSQRYNAGDKITVTSAATYYAIWGADLTITISGNIDEIKMMEGTEQVWKDVPEGYFSQAGQSANREDVEGFLKGTTFRIKAKGNSNFNAGAGKAYTSSGATVTFWTEDSGKTLFVQLPNGVTVDTTITITTEVDKFTVSYVPNGGTAVEPDLDISSGTSINPYNKTTTREGYTFDGWYSDAALTQKVTGAVQITAHTTFYAKWKADGYRITYNLDGGSLPEGVTNPDTYTVESEDFVLNNPIREGYTFAGWTGTDMTEVTKVVTVAQGSSGNRRYTATWTPITYTITYVLTDSNGVIGTNHEGNPATYTVESGEIVLKDPTPPAGYKFVKWVEGNTIADGAIGDKAFTAVWEPALTSLTIQVTGCNDSDQVFIFTVKSIEDNVDLKVTVKGSDSVTIQGVTIGKNYTVTMEGWSWRYGAGSSVTRTINGDTNQNLFAFNVTRSNDYWLDGNDYFQG